MGEGVLGLRHTDRKPARPLGLEGGGLVAGHLGQVHAFCPVEAGRQGLELGLEALLQVVDGARPGLA